jgi:hypothetical protein
MPTIGDIYRFTSTISYLGQDCKVVDFREIGSLPANPLTDPELAHSYGNLFVTDVIGALSTEATLTNVEAENLTDGLSFGQWAFNDSGIATGDPMPSYVAIGIKLARSSKLTRNGYKRIPGVPEVRCLGNVLTLPPTEKDNLEYFFGGVHQFDDITSPGDFFDLDPVIVGRTLNGEGKYELDLTRVNPITSAQVQTNVTTQNSRKQLA